MSRYWIGIGQILTWVRPLQTACGNNWDGLTNIDTAKPYHTTYISLKFLSSIYFVERKSLYNKNHKFRVKLNVLKHSEHGLSLEVFHISLNLLTVNL